MISRSSVLTGKIGSAISVALIALVTIAILTDLLRFAPPRDASYPNVYASRAQPPVAEIVLLAIGYAFMATVGWMLAAQRRSLIPAILCIGVETVLVFVTLVIVHDSGIRYGLILVPLIVQTSALPLKPRLILSGAIIVLLMGLTLAFYNFETLLRDFTARQINLAVVAILAWLILRTERTRSEAQYLMLELRKSNKRLREYTHSVEHRTSELSALLAVSQTIVTAIDRPTLLTRALTAVKRVVDYRQASLFSVKPDGTIETHPTDPWTRPALVLDGASAALRTVIDTRTPLIVADVRAQTETADSVRQLLERRLPFTQSWMCVPLIARDQVMGLIVFEHDEVGFYNAHHSELALVFANQLASAMEHARLTETARNSAAQNPAPPQLST